MKISFIFLLLLIVVSCRKEEGIWDKLTQAEKDELMSRATTQCTTDSNSHFNDFKTRSGDAFYNTGAHVAGITFNHSLKDGTTEKYTHKITVWRVTATDVYFLVEVNDTAGDEYRFLKIPKATNEAMITALQTKHCDQTAEGKADGFSLTVGSKTFTQVKKVSNKENTYTYTYSPTLLAFFSKYKESRKVQPLDTNGKPTGTVSTLTGTLSTATTETNIPLYDTYLEYVGTGIPTYLCIVNYSTIPYDYTCTTDGTGTFPASELNLI